MQQPRPPYQKPIPQVAPVQVAPPPPPVAEPAPPPTPPARIRVGSAWRHGRGEGMNLRFRTDSEAVAQAVQTAVLTGKSFVAFPNSYKATDRDPDLCLYLDNPEAQG